MCLKWCVELCCENEMEEDLVVMFVLCLNHELYIATDNLYKRLNFDFEQQHVNEYYMYQTKQKNEFHGV